MPDLTTLPLDQLLHLCVPLPQCHTSADEQAWHELQRRAFLERNDAAWDALILQIWPSVLIWIYERAPDITPADAERLAQLTLWGFCQAQLAASATSQGTDMHHAGTLDDMRQAPPPHRSFNRLPAISGQVHRALTHALTI